MAGGKQKSARSLSNRIYPLPNFHFQVEWGTGNGSFTEVTGLDFETEIIEYRTGDSPDFGMRKMPGLQKYSNITLKRGIFAGDAAFWDWINTIQMHTVERRDVTISLLNEQHEPAMSWSIINAWPLKVEGPGLKATGNEVAIETMELAHEGIRLLR